MLATLRYFGAIKIQEVLTKSSKIHSAHMTRNLVGRESAARVQISDPAPRRAEIARFQLFSYMLIYAETFIEITYNIPQNTAQVQRFLEDFY